MLSNIYQLHIYYTKISPKLQEIKTLIRYFLKLTPIKDCLVDEYHNDLYCLVKVPSTY